MFTLCLTCGVRTGHTFTAGMLRVESMPAKYLAHRWHLKKRSRIAITVVVVLKYSANAKCLNRIFSLARETDSHTEAQEPARPGQVWDCWQRKRSAGEAWTEADCSQKQANAPQTHSRRYSCTQGLRDCWQPDHSPRGQHFPVLTVIRRHYLLPRSKSSTRRCCAWIQLSTKWNLFGLREKQKGPESFSVADRTQ